MKQNSSSLDPAQTTCSALDEEDAFIANRMAQYLDISPAAALRSIRNLERLGLIRRVDPPSSAEPIASDKSRDAQ